MPDALQVLVTVKAASVNPVDFKIRNGQYPAVKEDRLPYTLGRDVSGVVEKCGAQATRFAIGDGVRALRYTAESDGKELEEILGLVASGAVKPHVQKTYPLEEAARAMSSVEHGGSVGKVILTVI